MFNFINYKYKKNPTCFILTSMHKIKLVYYSIIFLHTVDGFNFLGTNFRVVNKNDQFVGFRIPGYSIFLHNLYRKSQIHGYWNSLIRPSTKTTKKIGTPFWYPTKIKPFTVLKIFIIRDKYM